MLSAQYLKYAKSQVTDPLNSLSIFLKYARFRYILHRVLLRIKLGKKKRDQYFRETGISHIDFLPERAYSMDGVRVIPRKGTHDFYMFFVPREGDVKPHLGLQENETFLDIGANIGSYSLRIANDYKEKGVNVISIEAHPDNYKALCRNIACNKLKNITAINKAVSANKGIVNIHERFHSGKRVGSDLYSMYDTFLHPSNVIRPDGKVIQVECDTLDSILTLCNTKVDVMKMDIEGAEVLALQAAPKTLSQVRKAIVEVHGENLEAVKQIFSLHNFKIEVTDAEMKHVVGTKQMNGQA